jgi:hypothetical protein
MKIAIELLSILFLIFIFIAWLIWKKISDWRIRKKYNPNDDKSRKGEEQRRANQNLARTVEPVAEPADSVPEPSGLKGRTNIPTIEAESIDKDSNSIGKQSATGFFSRFKRK